MGADQRDNARRRQMQPMRAPLPAVQSNHGPVMSAGMVAPGQQNRPPPVAAGGAAPMPAVQSMKKGGKVKAKGCGCATKGITKGKIR